jgi:hypothetical protein
VNNREYRCVKKRGEKEREHRKIGAGARGETGRLIVVVICTFRLRPWPIIHKNVCFDQTSGRKLIYRRGPEQELEDANRGTDLMAVSILGIPMEIALRT